MMGLLIKTCLAFAQPLGFAWLLLTFWLIGVIFNRSWRTSLLPALAWLILTVTTCTPLSSWLLAFLENDYPQMKLEEAPVADVILCLGGGAEPSLTEPTGVHFTHASDRVATALMLAAQKKGAVLVMSGGGFRDTGQIYSEADAVSYYLQRQRATDVRIVSLGVCDDTHDEALKMADLALQYGWRSIVLVTSASHMSRAVATFRKTGLLVVPVPCNYQSSYHRIGDIDYLHAPQPGGFENFSIWFHEIIGTWLYRSRGWIN